jgi:hypothetical protein
MKPFIKHSEYNQKLRELEEQLKIAEEEYSERWKSVPDNLDFLQYEEYMSEAVSKVREIGRKIRMMKEPTFEELPDHGDVMSLEQFIECVKSGGFIDYDGFGHYVKDGKESDITIYPSDLKHNAIREDFDTIIWYNR